MRNNKVRVVAKSAVGVCLGLALVVGVYQYGLAKNRGAIAIGTDSAITALSAGVILLLVAILTPRWERRWIGDFPEQTLVLQAGEVVQFRSSFLSGQFYREAQTFNPTPGLRRWASGGPINIRGMLKVCLTSHRLIFGRFAGPTYRMLPLRAIVRYTEIQAWCPNPEAVLIEYEYRSRREGVLIWTNSTGGRRFSALLGASVPPGREETRARS